MDNMERFKSISKSTKILAKDLQIMLERFIDTVNKVENNEISKDLADNILKGLSRDITLYSQGVSGDINILRDELNN